MNGGRGDDIIYGDEGDDKLVGRDGNDMLFGGAGNDRINGGNGNDILTGGEGDDTLWGGAGEDVFVFSNSSGSDKIRDFESGIDLLDFGDISFASITQTITDQGLHLFFDGGDVFIRGQLVELGLNDFLF